ncbi:MAG: apolipoprotein N-acyltransferase [Pirellulaceae bacterium]
METVPSTESPSTLVGRLTRSVFGLMAIGGLLLWLSMPPVGWSLLAWVAPTPWCLLILRTELKGKRPYRQIWMAAWFYWLATLYFIPIPHPLLWIGWVLMSAVLAFYPLILIAASRQAVWRWNMPSWLVIPIVWAGLEWIRGQGPLGFGMVYLSHSQYQNIAAIQVASIGGAYLLSALMVLFAVGCAYCWIRIRSRSPAPATSSEYLPVSPWGATVPVVVGIAISVFGLYSYYSTLEFHASDETTVPNTIIVQGAIDTEFPDEAHLEKYLRRRVDDYRRLTRIARDKYPDAELIVWPESAFLQSVTRDAGESSDQSDFRDYMHYAVCEDLVSADALPCPPLLTGGPSQKVQERGHRNSAMLLHDGQILGVYDKVHRVPFGEYIPFLEFFPQFESMTPIGVPLIAGEGAKAIEIPLGADGAVTPVVMLPSVCFESTVPHLIRNHFQQIESNSGGTVDWMVNLTDDGWFFGTSCLDFHLANNVFRAVEMRRPMLVAANTGFSAEISPTGKILQQGERRGEDIIALYVGRTAIQTSFYRAVGDIPWMACGAIVLLLVGDLFVSRQSTNSTR